MPTDGNRGILWSKCCFISTKRNVRLLDFCALLTSFLGSELESYERYMIYGKGDNIYQMRDITIH